MSGKSGRMAYGKGSICQGTYTYSRYFSIIELEKCRDQGRVRAEVCPSFLPMKEVSYPLCPTEMSHTLSLLQACTTRPEPPSSLQTPSAVHHGDSVNQPEPKNPLPMTHQDESHHTNQFPETNKPWNSKSRKVISKSHK